MDPAYTPDHPHNQLKRKRVSLVIDGQTVLPTDTPLSSVGSEQSLDAPLTDVPAVSTSHDDSENQASSSGVDENTGAPPTSPGRVGALVFGTDLPLVGTGLTPPRRGSAPDGLSANEILAGVPGNQVYAEGSEASKSSCSTNEDTIPGQVFPNTPTDYPAFTPEQVEKRRQDSKWERSSISDEISALPSSSKASLERVRERSVEPHPPSIRRVPDYSTQGSLDPKPNSPTEIRNPVKDPNWPDAAFSKPESEGPHLASEVEDQIEKWTCEGPECKMRNRKDAKKCEKCGRKLRAPFYRDRDGRAMGRVQDEEVDRPTDQASRGGIRIPVVPGLKKQRQPNVF